MPKGMHGRQGPPPSATSARSEKRADGWTDLPSRWSKRAPAWPLGLKRPAEETLWRSLWRKPQAAMWSKRGMTFQVAAYVRAFLESTEPGAPASLKTAVLRQEDSLGISLVGLAQLRWRIVDDEVASARAAHAPVPTERAAPVRRLRSA